MEAHLFNVTWWQPCRSFTASFILVDADMLELLDLQKVGQIIRDYSSMFQVLSLFQVLLLRGHDPWELRLLAGHRRGCQSFLLLRESPDSGSASKLVAFS